MRRKKPQHHITMDPRKLLGAFGKPGLLVTGVNTDIGKTTVTAALAGAFSRLGIRVGICKPIAAGCPKHPDRGSPEGLTDDDMLSPDAEISMNMIGLNPKDPSLLAYASPIRFAAPVSPYLAAKVEERSIDWQRVVRAMDYWREHCDFLLVEAAGGWMSPLDDQPRLFTVADMAAIFKLPAIVVTGTYWGVLGHTMLVTQSARAHKVSLVGLVVNHVGPTQDLAMNTAPEELPKLTGLPVLAVLPEKEKLPEDRVPEEFVEKFVPFAKYYYEMIVGSRRTVRKATAKFSKNPRLPKRKRNK